MIDFLSISFDLSEQIRLSINRFEKSTFISLFVHFRHANIAAIKEAGEAARSARFTPLNSYSLIEESWKANRKIRF